MTDVAMIVHNTVFSDSRVRREAASLAARGWRVLVVGIAVSGDFPPETVLDGFTLRLVQPRFLRRLLPGKYGRALRMFIGYALAARELRRAQARVYHAHDFTGLLMLALAGLWRRVFVYDSHELYFDMNLSGGITPTQRLFGLLRPLEKWMAQRAAATLTVGEELADVLARTLAIPRPLVLWNAVDHRIPGQPERTFPTGQRLIVHSGGIVVARHLPELVAALAYLPEDVGLVLIGSGQLTEALQQQAAAQGTARRLTIVPPAAVHNVAPTLAQAHAAAVLIASGATSYHLALPNKFFEAVAAGLPIIASPIPEVKALVERYDLGVLCDPTDPAAIAAAIQTLLQPDNYARYRANAQCARAELTWEHEEQKLVALYARLLEEKP